MGEGPGVEATCYRCGAPMPRDETPPCPGCRQELHLEIVRFREALVAQVAKEKARDAAQGEPRKSSAGHSP